MTEPITLEGAVTVRPYKSLRGQDCISVAGPGGTWLITPDDTAGISSRGFKVWRSDSLNTRSTHSERATALEAAYGYASEEPGTYSRPEPTFKPDGSPPIMRNR